MASSTHTMKMKDISRGMRMNIVIRGVRLFTLRVRVAICLIKLAACVLPFACDITIADEVDG